jgi:beta-galactosidase/beta-glucuronidase
LYGPLDQGYWPDGLYTPPSEEAVRYDLQLIKDLGCNMLRKHVKVEPARYYFDCDRLGLIVWQDMPNGGRAVGLLLSYLANLIEIKRRDDRWLWRAGRSHPASRQEFQRELQALVDHLHNFPCIGMWVPFNEGWGQFEASAIADWLIAYDPTRPVDHASGWFDQGGRDIKSLHVYFKDLPGQEPETERGLILSEFGGYSLKVDSHIWNPQVEFGYRKFTDTSSLTEAYIALLDTQLKPWIEKGLSAAVYTQTTDVEIEVNGFVTYDRQVAKMDFAQVKRAHRDLWSNNQE